VPKSLTNKDDKKFILHSSNIIIHFELGELFQRAKLAINKVCEFFYKIKSAPPQDYIITQLTKLAQPKYKLIKNISKNLILNDMLIIRNITSANIEKFRIDKIIDDDNDKISYRMYDTNTNLEFNVA